MASSTRRPISLAMIPLLVALLCLIVATAAAPEVLAAVAAGAEPSAVLAGFDGQTFAGNDDGSIGVTLPFALKFYGQTYSSGYLNNNGNITFTTPLSTYTPYPLSTQGPAIIAAFFADVDTRVGNTTKYGTGTYEGHQAFGATWPSVGCYNEITSVTNTFQLLLVDRSDIDAGDFDIVFNYNQIQWQAGTASGSDSQCLHGTAARAGYASGSGATGTYYELPGSGDDGGFLDSNTATGLVHNSYGSTQPGRYVYPVRNGGATLISGAPSSATGVGSGNSAAHNPTCSTGRPVNCASGDFWHTYTDINLPERGDDLAVSRTYNSLRAGTTGEFGYGWDWTFGNRLTVNGDGSVTVLDGDGSQVTAQPEGTDYVLPTWANSSLTHNADGTWTFTQHQRTIKTFAANGQLSSIRDLNGNTTAVSRDGSGALQSITDPAGRHITAATDGSGRVTKLTDPIGRSTQYTYDDAGNLSSATDAGGNKTSFSYDDQHRLLTITDPRGGILTNGYDSTARVTQQTDPAGGVTAFAYSGDSYSATGGTTTITDPLGAVAVQSYVDGELVTVVRASGTSSETRTTYTYDPVTLGVTSITDPRGNVTSSVYDAHGNVTSSTDPLGRTTNFTYDDLNDVLTRTTPGGHTTTLTYDNAGNLLKSTDAAGHATIYSRTDSAHPSDVTGMTDPDGRSTEFGYDSAGDVSSVTQHPAAGRTSIWKLTYDGAGQRVCEASANATAAGISCPSAGGTYVTGTTAWQYDALGRTTSVTDPTGHSSSFAFDANGNRTKVTDANGNVTSLAYDADDRVTTTTRPDSTKISYTYDANGNALTYTDGAGNVTSYGYDNLNHQVSSTDPLNRATHYGYDGNGNRISLVDASSRTTAYEYDAGNQLTKVSYSDGSTPPVTYTYTADGQRESMTDGTGTSSYTYDAVGRLTHTTNGGGASIGYAYDNAGHVTTLTYPSGQSVTKTYDGAGQMAGITDWLGKSFSFGYDANGNIVSQADPNGVTVANHYDSADQLLGITAKTATSTLATFSYTRDSLGQVTGDTATGSLSDTKTYAYTSLNQLGSQNSAPYSYDPADNLTKLANGTTQTFDAANQLQQSTPTSVSTTQPSVAVDQVASTDQKLPVSQLVSPSIKTGKPGELILAFISAAGPAGKTQPMTKVSGMGLTWKLAVRANGNLGTAEVWQAYATTTVSGSVTAILKNPGFDGSITVASFSGAAQAVGATAQATAVRGRPSVSLTTTQDGSLVWAAGHQAALMAAPMTPADGQSMVHQLRDLRGHITEWAQKVDAPVAKGTKVTVSDKSVALDLWKLAAVEIVPAAASAPAPAVPTTYTYDAQGNRTSATTAGVTTASNYDQANRLVGYGASATYVYDGDGLRQSKTVAGSKTSFAWDEQGGIPLLLADGDTAYLYGPDGLPLEAVNGGNASYLIHDQQGSTRAIVDSGGGITGTYEFDPFGKVTSHSGTSVSLGYGGQYIDAESGLIYLRERYLDAASAQFSTVDPLSALSSSRYSYTLNNPLNLSDPTGLLAVTDCYSVSGTILHATGGLGLCFSFGTDGYSVSTTHNYGLDTGAAGASITNTYGIAGGSAMSSGRSTSIDANGSAFAGVGGTGSISQLCDGSWAASGGLGLGTPGVGASVTETTSDTILSNSWSQWVQDWHDTLFHPTTIWRGLGL